MAYTQKHVGDVRPLRVVRGDGGAERGPELFAVSAARRLVVCFSVSECEIRTVKCCGRSVSQANLYFFYKKTKNGPFSGSGGEDKNLLRLGTALSVSPKQLECF